MCSKPKIIKQCSWCGSENVRLDAYAAWDAKTQQWVLEGLYDHGFCNDCGAEITPTDCVIH